jgi:alkylhydroperoxidase family enzyme
MSEPLDRLRENVEALPPPPPAMEPYLAKVRSLARTVTDDDVAALKAAGIDEDVIFEQTVGAAIGEGLRRLEAAEEVLG